MKRIFPFVAALFVTLLVCGGATPHPSIPTIGSLDGLGVNIHFTDAKPGELEMIKAAGFKWVRMDLAWGGTERKPGEYDFAAYDRLVASLEKNSLRAVFILDYGNPIYDSGLAPYTDEGRTAFAKWAATAVKRYAGKGYLWEMWNEPNIAQFWKPKPDVQQYIALTRRVAAELRVAGLIENPKSKIEYTEAFIGPATSTIDLTFLEECFKGGLLENWAAVSVHPYRQKPPETVVEEYRNVRMLIHRYAPKDKVIPVLSGEWGYSTAWPSMGKEDKSREETQANYLAKMFLTNIANDVPLSIWYDWRDDGDDPKEAEHRFGIVRRPYREGEKEVFEPKPAYRAMQTLTGQLSGMRFNKDITPAHPIRVRIFYLGNTVLLFDGQEKSCLAVLQAENLRNQVNIPVGAASFKSVTINGGEASIQPNQGTLAFTPKDAVTFLKPEKPDGILQAAAAWKRLPLEVVAQAPKTVVLDDTWQNTSDKVRKLPGWGNSDEVVVSAIEVWPPSIRTPEEIEKSLNNARSKGTITVPRGEVVTRPFEISVERADWNPLRMRWLELENDGQIVRFSQHTEVHPTNPITAQVTSPGAGFLPVVVRNPSGEALTAKVDYYYDGEDYTSDRATGTIDLKQGESEGVILLTPERPEGHHWNGQFLRFDQIASFLVKGCERYDFPEIGSVRAVSDGDPKVVQRADLDAAEPEEGRCPTGTPSFRLRYQFADGWGFVRLMAPDDWAKSDKPGFSRLPDLNRLGMWVYGDAKGLTPRVRLRDLDGTTFQLSGETISWRGWRFVEFGTGRAVYDNPHWGGKNEEGIDHPITWDTVFLLDNASRKPVEGELYISAPTLLH